jgi:hypothetical protein
VLPPSEIRIWHHFTIQAVAGVLQLPATTSFAEFRFADHLLSCADKDTGFRCPCPQHIRAHAFLSASFASHLHMKYRSFGSILD